MKGRLAAVALAFLGASAARAEQDTGVSNGQAQCVAAYKGNVSSYTTNDETMLAIEEMSRNACDGSNSDITAGFDSRTTAIIEGVPTVSTILGNLDIKNNKKFCEAVKSGRLAASSSSTATYSPVVEALKELNQCMTIVSQTNGIAFTNANPTPEQILFSVSFPTSNGRTVFVSASTVGGFVCRIPRAGKLDVHLGSSLEHANFPVICERQAKENGGDYDVADGSVSLATNTGSIYTVSAPADGRLGLATRRLLAARIEKIEADSKANLLDVEGGRKAALGKAAAAEARLRSARAISWYYYQISAGSEAGTRYDCAVWNGGQAPMQQAQQLCSGGEVRRVEQTESRGGGNCGFNSFRAVCVGP